MRFWSQIVAFYFLQFINGCISVMMVLFHNTECVENSVRPHSMLSKTHTFTIEKFSNGEETEARGSVKQTKIKEAKNNVI